MTTISIKKNEVPILKMPTFSVDKELHNKLNGFELTKMMNKTHFCLFLGKPGSGKSSLAISFLQTPTLFKKVFHDIILFCPKNSRSSVKNDFWGKNLPETHIYDDLTLANLEEAHNVATANAEEEFKTLIIMDDVQKNLKNFEIQKCLLDMVQNRRHEYLCIWLLCQNYFSIPPPVRSSFTNLFVFKSGKKEMKKIYDEHVEMPMETYEKIISKSYNNSHDFLFLDCLTKRMFINWDEFIIQE
jgi:hypothetical protein